jgi:hypothetical protein
MDPIWTNLPIEISEIICNKLSKVRVIDCNIKSEIVSQRWMLTKILNWYLDLCDYNSLFAFSVLRNDLGIPNDVDVNVHWENMTQDDRINFFYAPYGPGTYEGRIIIEKHAEFRELIEETRDY